VKDIKDSVKILNGHLQGKEYLVGNHLTVADLTVAFALLHPFQVALDAGFRKAMPNISALVQKIVHLPEAKERLGHVKFAAKIIKPTFPAKKEEEKKAPAKKEEHHHAGGDDEEEAPKKKEANPLDVLPPTLFDLYAFKTFFVNSKDRSGEGMKFFFENYDREGYSIFFVHYEMYEGEGVTLPHTQNMLNGFLQRIDHFRKHVLATHLILGDEPKLQIEGVWLFRGKGIPQEMIDHP